MTIELYTELKKDIESRLDLAQLELNKFGKGFVSMTPEFRIAKNNFNLIFTELQILNKNTPNKILKEVSKLRRQNWRK